MATGIFLQNTAQYNLTAFKYYPDNLVYDFGRILINIDVRRTKQRINIKIYFSKAPYS